MAKRRLSMRKIIEVLRLHTEDRMSTRQIAKSCPVSHSTGREYLDRARQAGLTWPLDPDLDNCALEAVLFSERSIPADRRGMPPMEHL